MGENTKDFFTIRMVEDILFKEVKVIEEFKHWLHVMYNDRELRLIKNNIIYMEKLKNVRQQD